MGCICLVGWLLRSVPSRYFLGIYVLTIHRALQDHGSGWSALWDTKDNVLWDRGKPSPALIDLIEQRKDLFQPLTANGRRKKALIPVCLLDI